VQEERKSNSNRDANRTAKPSPSAVEEVKEQQNISNTSREIQDAMRRYEAKIMSGQVPQVGDSTRSDE
jgi:hypothetical protein